jgi:hypothetical protein
MARHSSWWENCVLIFSGPLNGDCVVYYRIKPGHFLDVKLLMNSETLLSCFTFYGDNSTSPEHLKMSSSLHRDNICIAQYYNCKNWSFIYN